MPTGNASGSSSPSSRARSARWWPTSAEATPAATSPTAGPTACPPPLATRLGSPHRGPPPPADHEPRDMIGDGKAVSHHDREEIEFRLLSDQPAGGQVEVTASELRGRSGSRAPQRQDVLDERDENGLRCLPAASVAAEYWYLRRDRQCFPYVARFVVLDAIEAVDRHQVRQTPVLEEVDRREAVGQPPGVHHDDGTDRKIGRASWRERAELARSAIATQK